MNKEIYNGINLNGNAISGIGTDDALATGGSLKYENGTLYYHNGTSWVAVSDGDVVTRTLQSTDTQVINFNLTPQEIGTLFDDFYNGYIADKYCVLIVDFQNTVNTGLTTDAFIIKDTSQIMLSGTLVGRTITFTNGYAVIRITKVYSGSDPNTITVEQISQMVYEEAYNINANPKPVCVSTHPNQNGTSHFTNNVTITPRTGELKAKKVTAVDGDTDTTTYTQLSPTEIKIIESEGASGEEQIIIDPRGAWKDSLKTIPAFGDMKYIGEIAEAVLPSGSTNGDVYKVTSDTEGEVFDPEAYPAGYWRTFTNSEINYIVNNYRHTFGVIGEQRGFFIFPNGVETTMTMNNMVYANNTITISEWEALEAQGVVFLPFTTIWRNAIPPTSSSVKTAYWSGSIHSSDTKNAECLCWVEDNTNTTVTQLITNDEWWTTWSMAIRLVHETTSSDTTAFATAASGDIKYLKFAKSNLIYKKNIGFKFTDNAYDTYNVCGQPSETGWFDTFEYDTSGNISSRPPWVKDTNYYRSINISGTERDWGVYNALGALTTGTFPAGTCFVNNNGELIPLGAAYTNSVYSKVSDVKIGTTTANTSSVVNAASHIATLLTNSAYNASTNKIATMADLDNLAYQIRFSYNSLNQTDPLIPVELGMNFSDIEAAYNAGKNIVFELGYNFDGTNETAYSIENFEYIHIKAEQGSTIPITVHDSQSQPVTVNVEGAIMFRKTFTDLARMDVTENISLTVYEDPTTHVTNIVAQYEIIPKNYADSSSAISIVGDLGGYDSFDVKIDSKRIVKQLNKGTITYTNDAWAISPTPSTINAGDYFTVGTAFTLTDDTLLFTGIIPAGSYTTSQHFVYDGSQWRIESANVGNGILTTAPDKFTIKYNMMESIIDPYTPQPLGIDLSVIKAAYDAGKKLSLILYAASIYDTAGNEYYEIKDFDWHYLEAEQGETIPINIKTGESQYTQASTDKCVMFTKTLSILGIAPETTTVLIYNDLTTNTTKIQIQSEGIYSPQAFEFSAIEIPQREFGAAYLDVKRDEATISTTGEALRTISHDGTNWVYTNPSTTPTQSSIVQGKYFVVAENGFTLNTDTPLFGYNVPAGTYIQNAKLFFNGSGWEIYGSSDISLRSGALYAKRMTGATANAAGTSGIVPQPAAGDNTKFLCGDGTWQTVSSGTAYTAGDGIDITNDEISVAVDGSTIKVNINGQIFADEVYCERYQKNTFRSYDNTSTALTILNDYKSAILNNKICVLVLNATVETTDSIREVYIAYYQNYTYTQTPTNELWFYNPILKNTIRIYTTAQIPIRARVEFSTPQEQVYQESSSTNTEKPILLANASDTNGTTSYSANATINPSTGDIVSSGNISSVGLLTENILVTNDPSGSNVAYETTIYYDGIESIDYNNGNPINSIYTYPDALEIRSNIGTSDERTIRLNTSGLWDANDNLLTPLLVEGDAIEFTDDVAALTKTIGVAYDDTTIKLNNSGKLYAETMQGADGTNAGSGGIVPAPTATDNTKYLKGDGSWSAVPSYNETYTKTELLALDNTADALALYNRFASALNEGKQCTLTVTGMETATPYSAAVFTNQYILDASSHDSTSDYDNIYFKTFDRGPSSNAPASDSIIIQVYPSSAPTTARIYFRTTGGVVNQSYTTAQQTSPLKVVLTSATTNTNGAVQYSPNITVTPSTNTLSAPKIVVSDGVYDSNNNLLTYSLSAGNGITFTDSGNTRMITAKTDNSSLKFNGSTMYVNIDDSTIKKKASTGKLYVPIDGTTIKINRSGWMCSDRRIYLEWYYSGSFGPGGAGATLERLVTTIDETTRTYDRASGHTQTDIDKIMTTVYNYMLKEAYVIRYKIYQGLPAAKAPQGVLEYVGMDAGFSLVDMASGFDCRFVMGENLLTLPIKLDFHIG